VTAIAGIASQRAQARRETLTRELLDEQRLYGSDRTDLASIEGASFAISPWRHATAGRPVFNSQLMIVADIRLDNRDELSARIGKRFDGSDTELLLSAWQKAGEECLSWIVGDFALAVFDSRSRRLTLARDVSGQVPLHYSRVRDDYAFASMPTGLRPFLGGLSVDRLTLAARVCSSRDDDPLSPFAQISRVLPGEVVRLDPTSVRRHIYWSPQTTYDAPSQGKDLVDEYRHVLDLAVASRLKGCSGPVATHLSSGYDSSAVTATAARLLPASDQIIAFTSAPATSAPVPPRLWRRGDESQVAAASAAAFGVRHVIVREMPAMQTLIRRQSLLIQEPVIGAANVGWLVQIRQEAAAAGANCLLSGECGNVTLNAGGLYVLAEWVRQGRWLTWARQARHAAARPDSRWRGVLFNSFNPWMPLWAASMLRRQFLFSGPADEKTSFLRPEWRKKALSAARPRPKFANGYEARVHCIRNGNPGMFRKGGIAGEGVEERDPLADQRLIEFSLKIPPEQLYWNGVSRPLARAALADRVPQSVIDLKLRGLQAADWALRFTQADARAMLEDISVSATAQELFDLERMRAAIDNWPTQDWNQLSVLAHYRSSLIGALASGMFALVHEQDSTTGAPSP
jgi:asparagine synthase (glutamine-hydrolysing)